MQLTIYIVAMLGALFLCASSIGWWRIHRDPRGDLTIDGRRSGRLEPAALLTAIALGLCGVAALGAVTKWFLA